MKKFIALILCGTLALAGCESSTKYGDCVGLGDPQNPKLNYKVSPRNVLVGVIFFEMIAPPVIVVLNETYCPVGLETN